MGQYGLHFVVKKFHKNLQTFKKHYQKLEWSEAATGGVL